MGGSDGGGAGAGGGASLMGTYSQDGVPFVCMADIHGAEQLLRHPVAVTLVDDETAVMIAASVAGEPPCTRLAWIDWRAATIAARLGCPPGRPSRLRPVVATDVRVDQAGIDERVVAARATEGVTHLQLVVADDIPPPPTPVGAEGIALMRVPVRTAVVGVDALSEAGEAVGRLDAAGIGFVSLSGGRIAGRLGASHGLAAGFGAGRWVAALDDAAFEAGFMPLMPTWLPDGLERGSFHIEPDVSYPAAPPSVAVAWGREPHRVLVRQAPGVLASPDPGGPRTQAIRIGPHAATLTARGRFATLVWETDDRAIGIQVVGFASPGEVAIRVARSL